MKFFISLFLLLITAPLFAQTKEESEILKLSKQIFTWEVNNKIDSLENLFNEKFVVLGSNGETQSKNQYIARLKSGNFAHNNIEIEENTATVVNNTAVIVGKARFIVTVSGNKKSLHLSYTETFTRPNAKKPWTLMAMHANALQD